MSALFSRPSDENGYWKVAVITPEAGDREWVDYIPVQVAAAEVPASANRVEADGYLEVNALADTSGQDAWRDYTPIAIVTGRADAWSYGHTYQSGYIPVLAKVGSLGGLASLTFNSSASIADQLEDGTDSASPYIAGLVYDATANGIHSGDYTYPGDGKVPQAIDQQTFDATSGFDMEITVHYIDANGNGDIVGLRDASTAVDNTPAGPALVIDRQFSRIQPKRWDDGGGNPAAYSNGSNTINFTAAEETLGEDHTLGVVYDPNGGSFGTIAWYFDGVLQATYNLTSAEANDFTESMAVAIGHTLSSGEASTAIKAIEVDELGSIYT